MSWFGSKLKQLGRWTAEKTGGIVKKAGNAMFSGASGIIKKKSYETGQALAENVGRNLGEQSATGTPTPTGQAFSRGYMGGYLSKKNITMYAIGGGFAVIVLVLLLKRSK